MRKYLVVFIISICTLFSSKGIAGEKDMIFILTGYPGTTSQAQGHIDRFLRHVEKLLGWTDNCSTGAYYSDPIEGSRHLESDSPGMAVVTPDIYLRYRVSHKMKIIAKVRAAERSEEQLSVVVKKGTFTSLEALKGKKVAGMVLSDPKFVSNIVFGKKLNASDVELVHQPRPLSGLRAVHRGKVDAAVVDQAVVNHLKTLSFGKDLDVIHTSVKLPPPVVVSMPAGKSIVEKFKSKLNLVCGPGEGKGICKSIQLESIEPAGDSLYESIRIIYGK